MPTLYTSLLARHRSRGSVVALAPKNQLSPVAPEIESLSAEDWRAGVTEKHAGYLDEIVRLEPPSRSVAVIGAGLAGLSAAYELRKRGYAVTIFEASDIPGGRTRTIHKIVEHHPMDGGAELIGSNHALWLNYKDIFGLGFSNVLDYKKSPIIVGTKRLSAGEGKTLLSQMDDALGYISARAKTIVDPFSPWTDPQAVTLDQEDVYAFVARTPWSRRCKDAVLQQLESDNGVMAKKQSLLALLAMVKGGGMERYWVDTEVYRCKRGAQALSLAFAAALQGLGVSIQYNRPITQIDAEEGRVKLIASNRKLDGKPDEFDDVILAIPPSAWTNVSIWLPDSLASFLAAPPQMGKNIKLLLSFRRRFWKKQGLGPNSTLNGPVDQTWETTESHPKPEFGLVAFSGADHAELLSRMTDVDVKAAVVNGLERIYKRTGQELTNCEFMNWPNEPWALASYSFPDCGDIMRWGQKFSEGYEGKLHFVGEHTCYAFTGYMEGALQSGYRLARKLVFRDGRKW